MQVRLQHMNLGGRCNSAWSKENLFLSLIGGELLYKVVLVSVIYQRESHVPSLLNIPLLLTPSLTSRLSQSSTRLGSLCIQQLSTSYLFYYMWQCMFQCYSLILFHPLLSLLCPWACYLCLCLKENLFKTSVSYTHWPTKLSTSRWWRDVQRINAWNSKWPRLYSLSENLRLSHRANYLNYPHFTAAILQGLWVVLLFRKINYNGKFHQKV